MRDLFQKIKRKVNEVRVKTWKFIRENPWFFISIVLTAIFILSPLCLRCSWFSGMFSCFLLPLKEQGYKSSYIETLGAILGTFLAITGALWTQRRFDQEMRLREEEKEEKLELEKRREKILIIYYDFKFVLDDIKRNMSSFQYKKEGTTLNVLDDVDIELFRKCWKNFKVHIYHEWIANVASVSKYFTKEDIKKIYEIYGDFDELDKVFNRAIEEISSSELKFAYKKTYKYITPIISLSSMRIDEVNIEDSIINLLDKLQDIGGF